MKTEVARNLLPLVNDPLDLESLLDYVEDRVTELTKTLELATDFNEILRTQGQIRELRRFDGFRDRVLKDADDGK